MAIHDVDKRTTSRGRPSPQMIGKSSDLKAIQTISTAYKGSGDDSKQRMQMVNDNICKYDTDGNLSILFGNAPDDGRPGLWIVVSGLDVNDELNA